MGVRPRGARALPARPHNVQTRQRGLVGTLVLDVLVNTGPTVAGQLVIQCEWPAKLGRRDIGTRVILDDEFMSDHGRPISRCTGCSRRRVSPPVPLVSRGGRSSGAHTSSSPRLSARTTRCRLARSPTIRRYAALEDVGTKAIQSYSAARGVRNRGNHEQNLDCECIVPLDVMGQISTHSCERRPLLTLVRAGTPARAGKSNP